MIRVTQIITGLEVGGAELALHRLLTHMDRVRFEFDVVALGRSGPVADLIAELGIPVTALGLHPGRAVSGFKDLVVRLRRRRPHVVQTWMYHADLFGGLAARVARVPSVSWGLRQSDLRVHTSQRSTRMVAKLSARLSPWLPDSIVCCAAAAFRVHAAMGYDTSKMLLIRNGFVVPADPPAQTLRAELALPPQARVVGRIARAHPQKDIPTFVQAASVVARQSDSAYFVMCGEGMDSTNIELTDLLDAHSVRNRTRLLGRRADMSNVYASLDLACSSSVSGEGFPNVVGESMALGIPNVVTDVGDSAALVGDTGWVVPPGAPLKLAEALSNALALPAADLAARGRAARRRVEELYSMEQMVEGFTTLYEGLV